MLLIIQSRTVVTLAKTEGHLSSSPQVFPKDTTPITLYNNFILSNTSSGLPESLKHVKHLHHMLHSAHTILSI